MGPLEAMVFLDASCYFWTRRGISARVQNERAAGRAGGQGKDGKTISGHVFGRAGGRTGCQSYFWTRLQQNYFWARLRAGGRADQLFSKIISGHVSGRAGGRTGWQSYLWTRLAISGRVVVFLHAFITSGRPGGRAGEGRMAKLFLDTSSGGCQSSFWTRLQQNYFWARFRAGGRADKLFKVISGHVFSKSISGHVSGRAGRRADRLAKLFLDGSCYFWTRRGISARVHNERAAGRAGEGRMAKLFLDTSSGGRAGGQAAKVISGHVFSKIISGHVSRRAGGRARKGYKNYCVLRGRRKILEASCVKS